MADQWTLPLYPPAGGTIIPGCGEPLLGLKTSAGTIPTTVADVGTPIDVSNCTSLALYLDLDDGSTPLTDYFIFIYGRMPGDSNNWNIPTQVWDISQKGIIYANATAASTFTITFADPFTGKFCFRIPTFGFPQLLFREDATGTATGSFSKFYIARGWAQAAYSHMYQA